MSDHRQVRNAGSAAARHPAGGSTRRRAKVSLSGGPFSMDLPYPLALAVTPDVRRRSGMDIRPVGAIWLIATLNVPLWPWFWTLVR